MKITDLELANKIIENQTLMISRLHEENSSLKENKIYRLESPGIFANACVSDESLSLVMMDVQSVKNLILPVTKEND